MTPPDPASTTPCAIAASEEPHLSAEPRRPQDHAPKDSVPPTLRTGQTPTAKRR